MCKKPLDARLHIRMPGGSILKPPVRVYIHMKGCMGARHSHLDIEFPEGLPEVLKDLLHVRGVTAKCIMSDALRVLLPMDIVLEVLLRGLDLDMRRWRCYLFKKNGSEIYLSL
ncbi:MAG: hypothetical protein GSR86_04655 [Desulfurococcales archaeon]|nr:hypothetical protein [Desulfurococcales archaeon]